MTLFANGNRGEEFTENYDWTTNKRVEKVNINSEQRMDGGCWVHHCFEINTQHFTFIFETTANDYVSVLIKHQDIIIYNRLGDGWIHKTPTKMIQLIRRDIKSFSKANKRFELFLAEKVITKESKNKQDQKTLKDYFGGL